MAGISTQQHCKDFIGVPMTEDNLFFYSLVRTIKDYLHYNKDGNNKLIPQSAYSFARRWIYGYTPKARWGESDLELSFEEALELVGVAPENVPVIRSLLKDARNASGEERTELCKKAYSALCWHDNEPEEFSWIGKRRVF